MKKIIKSYEENGKKYHFSSEEFSVLINQRKHFMQRSNKKATKGNIIEELADITFVSAEAIKNWMYGNNGPSDIEQVKKIGDYFDVDYHQLLNEEDVKMENTTSLFDENTAQAMYSRNKIREIYIAILNLIDEAEDDFYYLGVASETWPNGMTNDEFIGMARDTRIKLNTSLDEIKDLIRENMLDIPESLFERLDNYCWSTLDNLISAITSFDIDPDGGGIPEFPAILEGYDEYFENREYLKELRELFKDYIVK